MTKTASSASSASFLVAFAVVAGVAAVAVAPSAASAVDVPSAVLPAEIVDATLQVGRHQLHLPAGHWVLVEGDHRDLGFGRGKTQAWDAWAVAIDGKTVRMVVKLSLPANDLPRARRWVINPCAQPEGILRADLSGGLGQPECLAIFGHENLRSAFKGHASPVTQWIVANSDLDPSSGAVEFAYMKRSEHAFGALRIFMPTDSFAADDDARAWATKLRDAMEPLFDGGASEATLPAVPATSKGL